MKGPIFRYVLGRSAGIVVVSCKRIFVACVHVLTSYQSKRVDMGFDITRIGSELPTRLYSEWKAIQLEIGLIYKNIAARKLFLTAAKTTFRRYIHTP